MKAARSVCVILLRFLPATGVAGASLTARTPPLADLSRSLQDLAAKVSPSVVQIFVTGYVPPDQEDQGATGEPRLERTNGSGVIVDADGYIVTNAHVVQNATRIEVELPFAATGGAPGDRSWNSAAASSAHKSSPSTTRRTWPSSRWRPVRCRRWHSATPMAPPGPDRAGLRQPARPRLARSPWALSAPSRVSSRPKTR